MDKIPQFSGLKTKRLYIRRFKESDAQIFTAYRADSEIARYQNWKDVTEARAREFIQELACLEPGTPGTWFQFAIELRETQTLIGDIGLHTFQKDAQQGEIGYTMASMHQHKGYVTEAVFAVLDYCFNRLNLHRITATTDTRNQPSIQLLERLRFRREAHFIQSYREDNKWTDEYLYAILRQDWNKS